MVKPISEYTRKRNFKITSEPQEEVAHHRHKKPSHALRFVIQKHDARRLHYDFRLEMNGTLKSWAVPKGPSLDPNDKRLAVQVEDHPLGYATFEGSIPKGQYGGGDVIVWDQGIWQSLDHPAAAYKNGKIKFLLIGEKLTGMWNLVRTRLRGSSDKEQWLLIKENDESARAGDEYDVVTALPNSVLSNKVIKSRSSNASKPAQTFGSNPSKKPNAKSKLIDVSLKKIPKPGSDNKLILPENFSPELATLVSEPPPGNWIYEIKFDGYRILTRIQKGKVQFFTRNGNDWTERLPLQAKAIAELKLKDCWLDGEVVVLNEQGLPSFQALQNAFEIGRSHDIIYYLFDAPYLHGRDLREEPLELRREELEKIIPPLTSSGKNLLRFSKAFNQDHRDILAGACAMSLEGIIGKKSGSTYQSRRSPDWIKLKCRLRQEFVIVGFTKPQGSRNGFGALLLAVYDQTNKSHLNYAGRVGTGFTAASLQELYKKISKLVVNESPLSHALKKIQTRDVQWIKPVLVGEVEFAEWTEDNIVRQASFIALRSDKPAAEIVHEKARSSKELNALVTEEKAKAKPPSKKSVSKNTAKNKTSKTVSITHPERIIDPESNATKKDVAMFYSSISPWILPHLDNRPVSILRAPSGITGEMFFQKHTEHLDIPNIKHLDRKLDPGHAALMEIDTQQALVGAVQMGTIELHTWGSTSDNIEKPNRIILDLDPDPALPWRSVVEATRLTLAVLEELKLTAFLKTTGGKGMHVVIPLSPVVDWDTVKQFSKAISHFMAQQIPERFVAKMGPQNRIGKIFIDYLRNQRGASTVSAYSVRARPGLPVSVPISQRELTKITSSSQWNIFNLEQRLAKLKTDPWKGYSNRQKITQAMWKKLGAHSTDT